MRRAWRTTEEGTSARRRGLTRGLVFLALVASFIACKSTSSPAGFDAGQSPCGDFYDATIAYETACTPGATVFPLPKTRSVNSCELVLHAPDVGDAAGDISRCAQDRRDAIDGCKPLRDCSYSPGTRANGAPCGTNAQCTSTFCNGSGVSTAEEVCGRCAPRLADGDTCLLKGDSGCSVDSACVPDATGTATMGTCKLLVVSAVGGPCNTTNMLCSSDGYCDSSMTHLCVGRSDVGGACKVGIDCKIGLACPSGSCVVAKKVGDACIVNANTRNTDCLEGLVCDPTDHTCHAPVVGNSGDTCDDVTTVCETACTFPSTGGMGKCQTVIANGDTCDPTRPDQACDIYAFCVKGACQYYDPGACVSP